MALAHICLKHSLAAPWGALFLLALCAAVTRGGAAAKDKPGSAADDLAVVRQRLVDEMLDPVSAKAARQLADSLRQDGRWPDIDYASRRRSSWPTARHLSRVVALTRAYAAPKSTLHHDPAIRTALFASLNHWLETDYTNPNWWWNQIGVPRYMVRILLPLDDELSDAQRRQGIKILRRAKLRMTAQNLVWLAEIVAARGILERDPKTVAAAYRRIAETIRITTAEGVQPDFSFHQHGPCLYNHGYGAGFAVDTPRIGTHVAGTRFAFPEEKTDIILGLILDGCQWMTRGRYLDFAARGRGVTRKGGSAGYLVRAARAALELTDRRADELEALADRAAGRSAPPLVGNRHFWHSDFMAHHRPGWYASARMYSRRIVNTDNPCNHEGLKNHHIADGCSIVMRTGKEYHNIYPVWDWQKVPGTTVEQKPSLSGSPRRQGETTFVGGVSDGQYGLAAFDFARNRLRARKSWVFFDDQFVCLGAGITCDSERPVVTTVNQCHLDGKVVGSHDGEATQTLESGTRVLQKPTWIWHDRVGYRVLQPDPVQLRKAAQSGSWWSINHQYSKDTVSKDVFALWIDHGTAPKNARYAYVVAPDTSLEDAPDALAAENRTRSDLPHSGPKGASHKSERVRFSEGVIVIRNDAALQAVHHRGLDILGAAFYEAGELRTDDGLTCRVDPPCLVLLRFHDDALAVTVSNPENKAAKIAVTIEARKRLPRQTLTFDLPGGMNAGKSMTQSVPIQRAAP
jgi:chondroitin AC lyase